MQKRFRKLDSINHKLINKTFKFAVKQNGNGPKLAKAGLDEMSLGEARLPSTIGPITRYNVHGKLIKLRHLPKVNKYTHSMLLEWQAWGRGPVQSKIVDFYRDCYQTVNHTPPSLELAVIEDQGSNYLMTPSFNLNSNSEEEVLHALNLMLEIFEDFQIFVVGEGVQEKYVRVNWRLIPPGERPFEYVMKHIQKNGPAAAARKTAVEDRQKYINSFNPDLVYVGAGGFSDYLAYEFKGKKLVVLESVKFGNAIYVFEEDWLQFSKLTKKEIIENELADRIVHSTGWKKQISDILN